MAGVWHTCHTAAITVHTPGCALGAPFSTRCKICHLHTSWAGRALAVSVADRQICVIALEDFPAAQCPPCMLASCSQCSVRLQGKAAAWTSSAASHAGHSIAAASNCTSHSLTQAAAASQVRRCIA